MIENRIFKDLLNVFIANLGRIFTWRSQMLTTVDSQIDLSISEIFWLVVREEKDSSIADPFTDL